MPVLIHVDELTQPLGIQVLDPIKDINQKNA